MDKKRPLDRAATYFPLLGGEAIQNEEAFKEIADAVLRLQAAFIRAGFERPVAIELASHEDGFRMRHILPRDMIAAYQAPSRDDKADDVMFTVMGMEFRYPAHYRKKPKGFEVL